MLRLWFDSAQFDAIANPDYSILNGNPTAFQLNNSQSGAVVNLGNLRVGYSQNLSLIGGTVINTDSLIAPAGSINIAAVEGENIVRISQNNQLLSLEVEARPLQTMSEITTEGIGEMLTGSGFEDATALVKEANGTVRLRNAEVAVDERGGEAIATLPGLAESGQ